jgi:lipid-A-disaccharide synthase-like uncharacterized protein
MDDATGFLRPFLEHVLPWLYVGSVWWTMLGLVGTTIFGSRFVVQWLYSERQGRLVVPAIFWYLSFWGSVITLIYAFHVDKLPFILSNLFLPFLYARNLSLLRRGRREPGPKPKEIQNA